MIVDITINPKSLETIMRFEISNLKNEGSYKECIAIIAMIAGDYSLDPELEISDLQSMVKMALDKTMTAIIFEINEDGLEAELSN